MPAHAKPTIQKITEGDRSHGKSKFNRYEAFPQVMIPPTPEELQGEALAEWNRIAPILERQRLLTEADRMALACLCHAWECLVIADRHLREEGMVIREEKILQATKSKPERRVPIGRPFKNPWMFIMTEAMAAIHKFSTAFGLTPEGRAKVAAIPGHQEDDPALQYIPAGA